MQHNPLPFSILCCTNLNPFQSKLCSTRARNVGYKWSVFTIDILCPHNSISIYMCGGIRVKSILVSCFSLGKRLPQRTGFANACLRILIPGSSLHRSTTRQVSPNPPVLYGKLRHRFHTSSLWGFDYTFDEKSAICKSRSTSANTFSEKSEGSIF